MPVQDPVIRAANFDEVSLGFDLENALEAACRGWFVGLVNNRTKR